jgi:hypothetical protein
MDEVIKMLVRRLDARGMSEGQISACISSVWSIFLDQQATSCQDFNFQMQERGWPDFELDEQTFKMASSAFTK